MKGKFIALIAVIVVVMVVGVGYFALSNREVPVTHTQVGDKKTYTNAEHGFTITYSSEFEHFVDYDGEYDPLLNIIVEKTKSTGGVLYIDLSPVDACLIPPQPFEGYTNFEARVTIINEVEFLSYGSLLHNDGQYKEGKTYKTLKDGYCYDIGTYLDSPSDKQLSESEIPSVYEARKATAALLEEAVHTFKFKN